jgi:hypothetical protein
VVRRSPASVAHLGGEGRHGLKDRDNAQNAVVAIMTVWIVVPNLGV